MPLVQKPFGDVITFTRASSATMFDSSGTLVYAPMNLFTYSEQFDDSAWTKTRSSIIADDVIAPDGGLTGDKLVEDTTASSSHQIQRSISVVSGITYTRSLYAKAAERDGFRFQFPSAIFATAINAYFDLTNGVVAAVTSPGVASITPVGNGWYRCTLTATATATGSGTEISCGLTNSPTNPSYTGDGTSGIYIWGAQLNQTPMQGGVTADLSTYYPTTSAVYQGPRLDYDPATLLPRGFLVEEQRTNSIRNNTMQGAVAGTPGTIPTNWIVVGLGTLTQEIVGTGTDAGITYVDFRLSGTTSTSALALLFDATTQIVAASGQTWTSSYYIKLQNGSTTNITGFSNQVRGYNGGVLQESSSVTITLTSSLERSTQISTLANASTTRVINSLLISFASGVAIDITLRIGLPQLELGAFATSVIPTTTTALTRSADVAAVNTLSPWFNGTDGTLYAEFVWEGLKSVAGQRIVSFDDGTSSNFWSPLSTAAGGMQGVVQVGGVAEATNSTPVTTYAAGILYKQALALELNNSVSAINGTAGTPDTSVTVPTVNTLRLAANASGATNNIWFRRITYYPRRLSNAELQAITA